MAAVGTVVMTSASSGGTEPYLKTYTLALTTSAGGAVSANPQTVIAGRLVQVKVRPATGGTQPTDQFDLTINDADGVDLLAGAGANRSNGAAAIVTPTTPVYLTGTLTIDPVLANGGAAKVVTIDVVMLPY